MPQPHLPQRGEWGKAEDGYMDAKDGAARTRTRTRTRKDYNNPNGAKYLSKPKRSALASRFMRFCRRLQRRSCKQKGVFWPAIRVLAQISGFFRPAVDAQAKNPRSANSSLETKLSNRARTRIAGQKTEICEHDASNSPAKPKSERRPSPARPFSFAPASLPRPPSGRTPYSRALTESEPQPHP